MFGYGKISLGRQKGSQPLTILSRWVVRRDHLHSGLAESCRRHGVNLVIDARVAKIDYSSSKQVTATTTKGATYTFDLLIGSDGIKSVVRSTLFPDFRPYAPTTNACYRAVIPYTEVFAKVPEARTFLRNSIDVWGCDNGYVIGYPISGGQEFNLVLSHHRDNYVEDVEEVDMDEFRAFGKGFHPIVQKIINICPYSKRWPLMVTELKSWSSPQKNVVLMGDAAHSMVNHMAQGAATAMEDGAFLGTVIGEVLRGTITMPEAVELYEKTRMPRVWAKQQGSFMMGSLIMYAGDRAEARNKSSRVEVRSVENNPTNPEPRPSTYRSWVLWANPESVPHMATYDAEGDADMAVCRYLQERSEVHPKTRVAKKIEEKWWGYVRPGIFEPQDEKSGAVEDDQGMWKFARKSNL